MATGRARSSRKPRFRRRSVEEGRREILDAAADFLSEKPFRALTVARLMERASIGRSAFYSYFRDIYQVVEALLREAQQEILNAAVQWGEGSGHPAEDLREMLARGTAIWARRGYMLRAITDAAALDERLESVLREAIRQIDAPIADVIRREQAAGRIGRMDPDETAIALNQLNLAYLNDRLGHTPPADPRIVAATLGHIWISTLYGVQADAERATSRPAKEESA